MLLVGGGGEQQFQQGAVMVKVAAHFFGDGQHLRTDVYEAAIIADRVFGLLSTMLTRNGINLKVGTLSVNQFIDSSDDNIIK